MKPITLKLTPSTIIIIILSLVIIAMTAIWRPWEAKEMDRTLTSTGQATVESTPDEFVFSPYFQRNGTDTAKLKSDLDTFGKKLLVDLEKLGLAKEDITLGSSSYESGGAAMIEPSPKAPDTTNSVTLSVTIKASSQDLAQKVQNYLATTDAKGQLTSQPTFSKEKRKTLENQARDKAIADARSKAEQTAKGVSASIGKAITIKDSASQGSIYPTIARDLATDKSEAGLPVTPGKDSVTLGVEVVFELK